MSTNSHLKQTTHTHQATQSDRVTDYLKKHERLRITRYITGSLSTVTAIIYFLIGFNILVVIQSNESQLFGIFAGIAYAFGALVLLILRERSLWIAGAVFQIFVIYTYFSLAPQRLPEFEPWGIILRIMQVLIFVGLMYLIIRTPHPVKETQHERVSGK